MLVQWQNVSLRTKCHSALLCILTLFHIAVTPHLSELVERFASGTSPTLTAPHMTDRTWNVAYACQCTEWLIFHECSKVCTDQWSVFWFLYVCAKIESKRYLIREDVYFSWPISRFWYVCYNSWNDWHLLCVNVYSWMTCFFCFSCVRWVAANIFFGNIISSQLDCHFFYTDDFAVQVLSVVTSHGTFQALHVRSCLSTSADRL